MITLDQFPTSLEQHCVRIDVTLQRVNIVEPNARQTSASLPMGPFALMSVADVMRVCGPSRRHNTLAARSKAFPEFSEIVDFANRLHQSMRKNPYGGAFSRLMREAGGVQHKCAAYRVSMSSYEATFRIHALLGIRATTRTDVRHIVEMFPDELVGFVESAMTDPGSMRWGREVIAKHFPDHPRIEELDKEIAAAQLAGAFRGTS